MQDEASIFLGCFHESEIEVKMKRVISKVNFVNICTKKHGVETENASKFLQVINKKVQVMLKCLSGKTEKVCSSKPYSNHLYLLLQAFFTV